MNIVAFFAHPDDEAMLSGGVLTLLAEGGNPVHYLCATRGEGGEMGEPPVCERQELGSWREQEMACAVQSLKGSSLSFLDYVDPMIGPDDSLFPYTDDLSALAARLVEKITAVDSNVLITHGSNGEYGHPAHVLSHRAAKLAVEILRDQAPRLYTIAAMFPDHPKPRLANQDDPAHLVLDISPVLKHKEAAAACYRSQHALFVRRASQDAGRPLSVPEVLMHLESLHRVYPAAGELQNQPLNGDPLAAILAPWVVAG